MRHLRLFTTPKERGNYIPGNAGCRQPNADGTPWSAMSMACRRSFGAVLAGLDVLEVSFPQVPREPDGADRGDGVPASRSVELPLPTHAKVA